MGRLILRYLAQLLFVLSPFIAPRIVTSLKLRDIVTRVSGIAAPPSEEILRAGVSCVLLMIVFFYDALDLYLPRQSRRKFRDRYLSGQFNEISGNLHRDVRVNVMYARRRWYTLWLVRVFQWTASHGFRAGRDRDIKIPFLEWQGVCGKALRRCEVTWEDLRGPRHQWSALRWYQKWLLWNTYRLTYWQLERTQNVRAILSIPMFRQKRLASQSTLEGCWRHQRGRYLGRGGGLVGRARI
jgi:hypothetical protein